MKQSRNWRQNQWGAFWIVEILSSLKFYYIDKTPTETEHIFATGRTETSFCWQTSFLLMRISILKLEGEAEIETRMGEQ